MTRVKRRRAILGLGIALSTGLATDASADPPYLDQITPGDLRGIAMTAGDPWVLGYWEYLPTNYDDLQPGELLPLLVFLPGIGEYDDDASCPGGTDVCAAGACGGDGLCHNLTWGPQQHMRVGNWDDVARPFIMVSPLNDVPNFSTTEWNVDELDAFFEYIVDNYPVDPRRMYLTGMSQGGRGVQQYVSAHPRRFTAVVPMPGGTTSIPAIGCTFQDTALWVFHGEDDNNANLGAGTFSPCSMVQVEHQYQHPDLYAGYQVCVDRQAEPGHPDGRVSMVYNVGHFVWQQAIDPVGLGFPATEWLTDQGCGYAADYREYSAVNDSDGIYSWFLTLDRPDVVAPADYIVPGDDLATSITATVTDDDTITWTWTQVSGPIATLDDVDQPTLLVSDLIELTQYTFEVTVVDADGQWDRDQITIDVSAGTGGGSSSGGVSGGSSSDGGSATDPTATTDPTDPTTDPTNGSNGSSSSDGGITSVTDTDASTGIVTSVTDTDASTGVVTSVTDTDASTGVVTSATDTDATTGVVTSATDTDATTGVVSTETGSGATETGVVVSDTSTSNGESAGDTDDSGSGSASDTDTGMTTTMTTGMTMTSTTATTDPTTADSGDENPTTDPSGSASQTSTATDPTAGSLSAGDASGGESDTSGGTVFGEDAPAGCGCTTQDDRPLAGAPWAMLVAFMSLRRRRRAA